jgi:hypothetical protein
MKDSLSLWPRTDFTKPLIMRADVTKAGLESVTIFDNVDTSIDIVKGQKFEPAAITDRCAYGQSRNGKPAQRSAAKISCE